MLLILIYVINKHNNKIYLLYLFLNHFPHTVHVSTFYDLVYKTLNPNPETYLRTPDILQLTQVPSADIEQISGAPNVRSEAGTYVN